MLFNLEISTTNNIHLPDEPGRDRATATCSAVSPVQAAPTGHPFFATATKNPHAGRPRPPRLLAHYMAVGQQANWVVALGRRRPSNFFF